MIRPATATDAEAFSRLHSQGFLRGWSVEEITALLAEEGVVAFAHEQDGEVDGFILLRSVFDECEILTIATDETRKRQGIGSALLNHACTALKSCDVTNLFLEVAEDNTPALGLYEKAGFAVSGRRRGYYPRLGRTRADAILMHKTL
ncbi:MAG: ribosomal-protein-alanine N-acetyltransferase [Alphaproteobacteria bacterium]|nr:ribosomal-protein-alanine N-acetyltransferase [Alphaproteobacteria bacterium]